MIQLHDIENISGEIRILHISFLYTVHLPNMLKINNHFCHVIQGWMLHGSKDFFNVGHYHTSCSEIQHVFICLSHG